MSGSRNIFSLDTFAFLCAAIVSSVSYYQVFLFNLHWGTSQCHTRPDIGTTLRIALLKYNNICRNFFFAATVGGKLLKHRRIERKSSTSTDRGEAGCEIFFFLERKNAQESCVQFVYRILFLEIRWQQFKRLTTEESLRCTADQAINGRKSFQKIADSFENRHHKGWRKANTCKSSVDRKKGRKRLLLIKHLVILMQEISPAQKCRVQK